MLTRRRSVHLGSGDVHARSALGTGALKQKFYQLLKHTHFDLCTQNFLCNDLDTIFNTHKL